MKIEITKINGIVESFVVMILLGLFALLGAKYLYTLAAVKQLDRVANTIVSELKQARSKAIQTNQNIQIVLRGNSWLAGWTVSTLSNSSGESLKKQVAFSEIDQVFESYSSNEMAELHRKITFKPSGMSKQFSPLGQDGINICNADGEGRNIRYFMSGTVEINKLESGCRV